MARLAETLLYARRPVERFIDIGSGPGFLMDAIATYLPNSTAKFFAVEKYPPESRTASPNYIIGDLADVPGTFDAGLCIEVIEHLTPNMARHLARALAARSNPSSLYFFNTGLPEYVFKEDNAYMDPLGRGHIVSWGWQALRMVFEPEGFSVFPVGKKSFAFAVEYQSTDKMPLHDRIWTAHKENIAILHDQTMGNLMYVLGIDTARAYS